MTDTSIPTDPPVPTVPTVPPILVTLVHDYSQKLLTAASIWALTHGGSQFINSVSSVEHVTPTVLTADLIQVGVGAAGLALSCAWTAIIAYLRKEKMTELLNFVSSSNA